MIFKIYTFLAYLLQPIILIEMLRRSIKIPAYRKRLRERYASYLDEQKPKKKGVLIHAASVGEVIAITPLVKALQKKYPHLTITFTTVTPTGSDRVKAAFDNSVSHFYLPYDIPYAIKKFLAFIDPKVIIVVETELWPNLIRYSHKRHIPFIVANARLSTRSSKRYGYIEKALSPMLNNIELIMAQDKTSAARYLELGIKQEKIINTGNLKFDLNISKKKRQEILQVKQQLNILDRRVWIAGSTHEGEDELILKAHQELLKKYPNLILILVPRHPERFESVADIIQKTKLNFIRRTEGKGFSEDVSVLLGDTMGEMMILYGLSDIAFVGGSLVPHGGHNPLEPIAFKIPVISGIHTYNFIEVFEKLERVDGAIEIETDIHLLVKAIKSLLENNDYYQQIGNKGFQVLRENQGALERHLTLLKPYLEKEE